MSTEDHNRVAEPTWQWRMDRAKKGSVSLAVIIFAILTIIWIIYREMWLPTSMSLACYNHLWQRPEMKGVSNFGAIKEYNFWTTQYYYGGFGNLGGRSPRRPEIEIDAIYYRASTKIHSTIFCHFTPSPTELHSQNVIFNEVIFGNNDIWRCDQKGRETGKTYCAFDVDQQFPSEFLKENEWEKQWQK